MLCSSSLLTHIFNLTTLPSPRPGVKAIQNSGVPLVGAFVGNKCEFRDGSIDSRAEVDILEARETSESLGMTYFETSAVSAPALLSVGYMSCAGVVLWWCVGGAKVFGVVGNSPIFWC